MAFSSRRAGADKDVKGSLFLSDDVKRLEVVCSAPYQQGPHDPQKTYITHPTFREQPVEEAPKEVWCFHCLHLFPGKPFIFHGYFCSPPCGKRYFIEHPDFNTPNILMLLSQHARENWGWKGFVPPAEPQIRLKVLGGDLPIKEFREKTLQGITTVVHKPPFITCAMVFEERRKLQSESGGAIPVMAPMATVASGEERQQIRGLRIPSEPTVPDQQSMEFDVYEPMPAMYDQFLDQKKTEPPASKEVPKTPNPANPPTRGSTMKAPTVKRPRKNKNAEPAPEKITKTSSSNVQVEIPKVASSDVKRGSLRAFMKQRAASASSKPST
jgi:hypothetical protein